MWAAAATNGSDGLGLLRGRAARTAVGCAAAVVVLWVLAVRTRAGHLLDNAVVRHRTHSSVASIINRDQGFMVASIVVAALAVGGLVAVAWFGRRRMLGFVAAGSVVAAVGTAEVLRVFVIERPRLVAVDGYTPFNSFPSGHTTVATAVSLALLMVAPLGWRRRAAVFGAAWVVVQGGSVIALGWHRPSDSLAGFAIGLFWPALAVWILAGRGQPAPGDPRRRTARRHLRRRYIGAVVVVAVIAAVVLVPTMVGLVQWGTIGLLATAALVALAGVLTVWWFWRMADGWTFDGVGPVVPGGGPPHTRQRAMDPSGR